MRESFLNISTKAAVAVLLSIAAVELIGVNRHVRRIVQVHFWELEAVLGVTLWAFLVLFVLKRGARIKLPRMLGVGFIAGLVSGSIGAVSLSVLNYHRRGIFNSGLWWSELGSFAGISMVATCGWLIGILSGLFLYFMSRDKP